MLKIVCFILGLFIISMGLWSLIPEPFITLPSFSSLAMICGVCVVIMQLFHSKKERIHNLAFLSLIFGIVAFTLLGGSIVAIVVLIWLPCSVFSIIMGIIFLKINNSKDKTLIGAKAAIIGISLSTFCISGIFYAALFYNPQGLYHKAVAYYQKGEYDRAINEYTKALKIEPQFMDAYKGRGEAYDKKGNYVKAVADYTYVIDKLSAGLNNLGGDYWKDTVAKVYYKRAIDYFFMKEYDKSWYDLHKAEELGHKIESVFLEDLKKASGREK